MIEIPVYPEVSSNFSQEIILGGRILEITIGYNTRSEYWYMNIIDSQSGESINNIKLVEDWLLLRQYKYCLADFEGDFIVRYVGQLREELSYNNFGTDFKLFYTSAEEAEAWKDYYGF